MVKIKVRFKGGCTLYTVQSLIPAVQAEIKPTEALLLGTVYLDEGRGHGVDKALSFAVLHANNVVGVTLHATITC